MSILTTPRLRLEPITDTHFDGLYAMNSDPEVMRYITGKADTRDDTFAMIERVKARWIEFGFSWWSFFESETNQIIGAGCIQHLGRDPANPLEIGWRLRRDKWGQGFASEAAQAMAGFAFDTLQGELLCAVCHQDNQGSAHVMKKLGMQYRGIERWYDMDTAVYEMTQVDWRARSTA
ncbi:GNAT family N-acetyltransferase [Undibacterium sp. Jales W-56]|uniref:GNAT family N-acetyltransferase n=1 Tax=Undibacterium sp. Jales W-56 TaxID=2897325 RepID=UPI0021D06CD9|nr:GNAT family N-acetyltransferase [Undibacterium sp. Jales W-56]MCU6434415.1 GNAT family N-acetyltransferase [Undibacterium sp. Jales W-56]